VARQLVTLARIYGNTPFAPLEKARLELGTDRSEFDRLLEMFNRIPALRTAVENGPSGRYWTNTVLGLEKEGVFSSVLNNEPAFPHLVGLYPGPTCMFRCHFCVSVTGARYQASALADGNEMFASVPLWLRVFGANAYGQYSIYWAVVTVAGALGTGWLRQSALRHTGMSGL
jgi:dTDP-4-amino-4,6-dideoxy-D-glucose ammonia-lyase